MILYGSPFWVLSWHIVSAYQGSHLVLSKEVAGRILWVTLAHPSNLWPLPLKSRGTCVASGLGPPHVWQYPGILLLWPESHYLERGKRHLGEDARAHRTWLLRYTECGRTRLGGGVPLGWARKASVLANALVLFPLWCFLVIPWVWVGFCTCGPEGR